MAFNEIVISIAEFLDAQKSVKGLELEGRLGVITEDSFDTNISEEHYDKIMKLLNTCKSWEAKDFVHTIDYFHNDKRFTERLKGGKTSEPLVSCMKKRKLRNFNVSLEDNVLDCRIGFSIEEPIPVKEFDKVKEKCKHTRSKKRHSYRLRNFRYDLTEIQTDNGTEIEITYEYEVEYCGATEKLNGDSSYVVVNKILHKLFDAVLYCRDTAIDISKINGTAKLVVETE